MQQMVRLGIIERQDHYYYKYAIGRYDFWFSFIYHQSV